jgi:hypothetical protein
LAGEVGGGAMRSELAIGVFDCLLWRVAGEGGKAMRWRRCSGLWPFRLGGVPGVGGCWRWAVGGGAVRWDRRSALWLVRVSGGGGRGAMRSELWFGVLSFFLCWAAGVGGKTMR